MNFVSRPLLTLLLLVSGGGVDVFCQVTPQIEQLPRMTYPERSRFPEMRRVPLRRNVWVSEYRFNSAEKQLLQPSPLDQQRFAEFLKQPDTGLIRLFPWGQGRKVVSVDALDDKSRPDFSVHASVYSFTKGKHGNGLNGYVDPRLGWAELKFGAGRFFTGFTGESLGVMVALGDMELDKVTPETIGVRGLADIIPPTDSLEATALSRRNRQGFEINRFHYGASLPAARNMTYAMRSTSNRRSDVLIGFKVTRVDEDGSVTILWRKLRSYRKPTWKRRD